VVPRIDHQRRTGRIEMEIHQGRAVRPQVDGGLLESNEAWYPGAKRLVERLLDAEAEQDRGPASWLGQRLDGRELFRTEDTRREVEPGCAHGGHVDAQGRGAAPAHERDGELAGVADGYSEPLGRLDAAVGPHEQGDLPRAEALDRVVGREASPDPGRPSPSPERPRVLRLLAKELVVEGFWDVVGPIGEGHRR